MDYISLPSKGIPDRHRCRSGRSARGLPGHCRYSGGETISPGLSGSWSGTYGGTFSGSVQAALDADGVEAGGHDHDHIQGTEQEVQNVTGKVSGGTISFGTMQAARRDFIHGFGPLGPLVDVGSIQDPRGRRKLGARTRPPDETFGTAGIRVPRVNGPRASGRAPTRDRPALDSSSNETRPEEEARSPGQMSARECTSSGAPARGRTGRIGSRRVRGRHRRARP